MPLISNIPASTEVQVTANYIWAHGRPTLLIGGAFTHVRGFIVIAFYMGLG